MPSTFLTFEPSIKTTIPATMATTQPMDMKKPVAHDGRVKRLKCHMKPQSTTWNSVLRTYIQTTISIMIGRVGCARTPVQGGSGMEVAGIGMAGLASNAAISSSLYGGGDSGSCRFFLL